MPHKNGHSGQYVVAGTRVPYSGNVVMIGGEPFTTTGGGIEGNNQRLESIVGTSQQTQQNNIPSGFGDDLGLIDFDANKPPTGRSNTSNPVTRTFVSRVVYYRQNGSQVPIGSDLHEHQNGTIMLGHDPNNMGAIVTRNQTINRTTRQTQRGTQTSTSTRQTTRRTGRMNTGRSTSGGSGGGSGY